MAFTLRLSNGAVLGLVHESSPRAAVRQFELELASSKAETELSGVSRHLLTAEWSNDELQAEQG